jgi:hypothetical protein
LRIDYGPHTITGNLIGLNADSTAGLTNTDWGIDIGKGVLERNIIGGDALGEANTIAYHSQSGINLNSEQGNTNQIIRQNKIYCNGNTATGIINSPVTKPTLSGSFTGTTLNLVIGNMDATGSKDIYLYKNTSCGANQGETFVAKLTGVASGAGVATYTGTLFANTDKITAMYVSSNGSSEFSDVLDQRQKLGIVNE